MRISDWSSDVCSSDLAFALFERMLSNIREDVTRTVARIDLRVEEPEPMPLPDLPDFLTTHTDPFTGEDNSGDVDAGSLGVIANRSEERGVGKAGVSRCRSRWSPDT